MLIQVDWVKIPVAAIELGRSSTTLRRLIKDGWLTKGKHYAKGPYENSPYTFNIPAMHEFFAQRAYMPNPKRATTGTTDTEPCKERAPSA